MDHKHFHSPHSLSLARCVFVFFLCSFVVAFLNSYVFICFFYIYTNFLPYTGGIYFHSHYKLIDWFVVWNFAIWSIWLVYIKIEFVESSKPLNTNIS